MSTITISNQYVQATISSLAAEVISFQSKADGLERVWGRDPKGWRNCNPILFPITGPLKDGKYIVDGKEYGFGQHGFARDSEFTIESSTADSATLSLTYSDETLEKYYPYRFKLSVTYQLEGYKLKLNYTLENLDDVDLPFMLGFHPAFNCPLEADEKFSDYICVFPEEEDLSLPNPALKAGTTFNVTAIDEVVNFFFYNHGFKSEYVELTNGKHTLRVYIGGYATLGFWHKNPDCPYICIEPWLPDNDFATSNVFKESDVNWLLPAKESFNCQYAWEIIR